MKGITSSLQIAPEPEIEQLRRKLAELERLLEANDGSPAADAPRLPSAGGGGAAPAPARALQVLDEAGDAVAALDREWRYTYVNGRAEALARMPKERLLGSVIWDLFPELASAPGRAHLERAMRERAAVRFEEYYAPSGLWVEVNAHPAGDGLTIFVRDISGRKRDEQRLRDSEERSRQQLAELEHLYRTAPVGLAFLDSGLRFRRVSERLAAIHGIPAEAHLGRTVEEVMPEAASAFVPLCLEAMRTGRAVLDLEIPAPAQADGGGPRVLRVNCRPVQAHSGAIGVSLAVEDITAQEQAEAALRQSEERYRTLFETTGDGILIVNDQGRYVDVNESYCRILKTSRERLLGAHFSEFIPPERLNDAEQAFEALRAGGGAPVDFPLRAADGSIVELAWTSSSHYLPGLYFCACRDITDRKRAGEALLRSERQLRFVLDHAPAFIAYLGTDFRYLRVNRAYEEWFGLPAAEIEGKHIRDAFGAAYFERVRPRLERVLAGESASFEERVTRPNGEERELAVIYTPERDGAGAVRGFIALLQDITDRKRSEAALRAREEDSRRLLAALPDVISRFDRSLRILYTSPAAERLSGAPPEHFFGKTHLEAGLPRELAKKLDRSLRRIFDTGQSETVEFEFLSPALGLRRLAGTGIPETDADGSVSAVLTIVRDITELKAAENERNLLLAREREARETAEILNRLGPMLLGELDVHKLVQSVTDLATRLVGAQFGSFFHNVVGEDGEAYMLYSLSGVPREAFAGFPMPRSTAVFAPTFRGEGVVRSDDITRDPRYGKNEPHQGMPRGHLPVKSYLAVPVASRSGEVLGGLFFGHAEPGRFAQSHEAIVTGIAAQAAIAMDHARLFEEAQWVQNELKRSNEDLRRANRDLETFAYSASHDLQEPLRNVTISAQLLHRSLGRLEGDAAKFFDGILQGSLRMQNLLRDLLAFTRATKYAEGPLPSVDASAILAGVLDNLGSRIEQTQAAITAGELPVVRFHDFHLSQLLQNLIGNALKYRGAQPPRVHLSAARQDGWWVFSVSDNGIGIDPKYAVQIFGLFKRLHSREEYPGSGVGLAICQRIVEQYGGRIWVEKSVPGEGSVFCFAVPDRRVQ